MKTIKSLRTKLSITLMLGCALVLITPVAKAQIPTAGAQTLLSFATCAASAATNINAVIDVSKQANVGIVLKQKNDASGTSAISYYFTFSVDGVTYDTVGKTVGVAAAGTATIVTLTNLNSFGAQYIKLNYITNADATANCTNLSAVYLTKISSP